MNSFGTSNIVKYYGDARERTKRRKSLWNWILLPLTILGILGSAFLMVKGLMEIQHHLIPTDVIFSGKTRIADILIFLPSLFLSLPLGFMFANFVAWCIPPARRALDKEADGAKGASFKEAMKLFCITTIILLIISAPLFFLGVFNYFYVTPGGVTLNSLFSIKEKHYAWSDVVRINVRYLIESNNFDRNYVLHMKDGKKIDLCSGQPFKFIDAYDKIKPFIKAQPHIVYDYRIGGEEIEGVGENALEYGNKFIKIIRNE